MAMTEADLDEIDCRAEAASREELMLVCSDCEHHFFKHSFGGCEAAGCSCRCRPDQCSVTLGELSDATAEFVTQARQDVFALLAEVRQLHAQQRPAPAPVPAAPPRP